LTCENLLGFILRLKISPPPTETLGPNGLLYKEPSNSVVPSSPPGVSEEVSPIGPRLILLLDYLYSLKHCLSIVLNNNIIILHSVRPLARVSIIEVNSVLSR